MVKILLTLFSFLLSSNYLTFIFLFCTLCSTDFDFFFCNFVWQHDFVFLTLKYTYFQCICKIFCCLFY